MKKIFTALFALLPTLFFAQTTNIFDVFYDHTTANCHAIDGDTLWVGGDYALMKRLAPNGDLLAVWDGSNSPLRQRITDISLEPGTQRVWMVLEDGGVALKDDETWQFWSAKEVMGDTGKYLPHVSKIRAGANGKIWTVDTGNRRMARWENGLWVLSGLTKGEVGYFVRFINDPQDNIWWLNEAGIHTVGTDGQLMHKNIANVSIVDAAFRPDGQLLMAASDGRLLRLLPSGTAILVYKWGNGLYYNSRILLDKSGRIYLVEYQDIYVFSNGVWQNYTLQDEFLGPIPAEWLNVDSFGNLWMGRSYRSPLLRFSNGQLDFIRSGIVTSPYMSIEQNKAYLWFSNDRFLTRYHIPDGQTEHFLLDKMDNAYNFATTPDGQTWLACQSGLRYFNGIEWKLIPEPPSGYRPSIYRTVGGPDGEVLGFSALSTTGDLLKIYHPVTQKWEYYQTGQHGIPKSLLAIPFYEANGKIWFPAGNSGIGIYDRGNWSTISQTGSGMPFSQCLRVGVTPDGQIWATPRDSLYRYDGLVWSFDQKFPCAKDRIWNRYIGNFFVDSRGWLWVSIDCGNIGMYDGKEWRYFNPETTNMPVGLILGDIAEDLNGDIWFNAAPALRLRAQHLVNIEAPKATSRPSALQVWPNPADQRVSVELPTNTGAGWLEVCDMCGRTLLRKTVIVATTSPVVLERGGWPPGIYAIRFLEENGKMHTQKVLFQ